jgi:hypothetical protein
MTSILKNGPNIMGAAEYNVGGELISGAEYHKGQAVKAVEPNTIIFDSKELRPGLFGGGYSIGFFYDSTSATVQGTPLMRIELYEDGELMPEDTIVFSTGTVYEYDLNFVNYSHVYGVFINKTLDPNKTHQLIIKTSPDLVDDVILDYVIFEKMPSTAVMNGMLFAQECGMRNGGIIGDLSKLGTQLVIEEIYGTIGTTSIPAGSATEGAWTYRTPFKFIIGAHPQIIDSNHQLDCYWSDWTPALSQISLKTKNISGSTWTKGTSDTSAWNYNNVRILVVGFI